MDTSLLAMGNAWLRTGQGESEIKTMGSAFCELLKASDNKNTVILVLSELYMLDGFDRSTIGADADMLPHLSDAVCNNRCTSGIRESAATLLLHMARDETYPHRALAKSTIEATIRKDFKNLMWFDEEVNDDSFHEVSFKLLRDMVNNQN